MNKFIFSKTHNLKPLEIVKKAGALFPEAKNVLDVGSGTGRNAVFLACNSHSVEATDVSRETIDNLNMFAKEKGIALNAHVANINDATLDFYKYNMVLFTFIMHYLSKSRGEEILRIAKEQARTGTVHVIAAITTKGDFFKKGQNKFYLAPGELKDIYLQDGWKVKKYFEEYRLMSMKKEDGTPMKNLTAFLIAQK